MLTVAQYASIAGVIASTATILAAIIAGRGL